MPIDPDGHKRPLLAIGAMLAASICYLAGDTTVKLATESLPPPQVMAIRGALTSVLILFAIAGSGLLAELKRALEPMVLLRGLTDGLATLCFTFALVSMRIADATAIMNAAPIAATVLAILFLRERVSALRWIAALAGFVGVVLVLQPEIGGIEIGGLLSVGAMLMVATREVVTRSLRTTLPTLVIILASTVIVALVGGILSAAGRAWSPVALREFGILSFSAVCLFAAYYLSVVALRFGEVSMVGPFRYAVILWGIVVGFIVWGDVPEPAVLLGMLVIVASGIGLVRSELRRPPKP